ncbi:bis(5'-nucleosyl)-tetraphosphatase (symmetrical) [Povalibacter uvarum]|uniref:Bis(5'-nucleosyl)-tetraphosphatase, symmetrical n=1 Tax=Povalibacter uvarum TaxID=732238 RepID=A0A841HQQ9_9GAMM|nr:symmetrical bis(5'-nucleosyl)-tetraphosphatase [Povalibacter uvarum]MBB6094372.1 bis(5'-nucleosyl)-tetraphosphatase (symmetrical) [Povalibacter uvarum]
MPTYAIGDIQGCCDEFELLLDTLQFSPDRDRLWIVGDLVNRGPRSADVLRKVKALGDAAITVLGNHDLHLLAVVLSPNEKIKQKDTLDDILQAPDRDELLTWLRHRPMLHHDASLGYTMIHAGLPPQWDLRTAQSCARELETALRDIQTAKDLFAHMYGDQPNRWSPDLAGLDRLRFTTNCLTRLRFCRDDGQLELKYKGTLQDAPSDLYPWFRAPHRKSRDLRIVCGHWSALGYHDGDGVLSIDTGCVWGSQLCAVRLDRQQPPVMVPCSSSGLTHGGE